MWTFFQPVKVTFGVGCAQLAAETAALYGHRPIIATDKTLAGLSHVQRIVATMDNTQVFEDIEPNPTVANVDGLAAAIRATHADVIIAIGGGSPLDCAKAASCLAVSGDPSIRAYHSEGKRLGTARIPVVALPTTAGTGSEVTPFAVLDDREKGIKGPIAADALYPVHALVDPELTYSLPRFVTACTGLDALIHAVEGYWSKNHQPICEHLSMEAARLIFAHLETACVYPENTAAREAMSYAALLAGMAFQLPKNAMVHACSYPLSTQFHLCHGAACAFTFEFAIRFNAPHTNGRLDALARYAGFAGVEEMAERVRELKRVGGLPCTLEEAKIPFEAVPGLVDGSFHPLIKNNPVEVTRKDLEAMYASLSKP